MENESFESVENLEVAEPESTSEETQEVAEPVSKSDAAFAKMRRELEASQRENQKMKESLGLFFKGDNADDLSAEAIAYHSERNVDEVKAEIRAKEEAESLRAENERLSMELTNREVEKRMESDLREIQKIDPAVKSLDDLGETFCNLVAKGVDGISAYYAAKARMDNEKITPAKAPRKLNETTAEKDYYTRDEVKAMSKSDIHKYYDKIRSSMSKW